MKTLSAQRLPLSVRTLLRTSSFLLPLLFLSLTSSTQAFPPAPYYTLYGMVRDQVGQTIMADGAVLVLLKGGKEVGRTAITGAGQQLDQNYEMKIRIDQNRSGTTIYHESAINAQGAFSLVVEMNGSFFYPIEVAGSLTAGKGGERVRLDLNLGEDANHDGLPDIWEQWQLYQAGYYPDDNGNWPLDLLGGRNGDFDHDGFTNWQEYLAGTFATDRSERFSLDIKEKTSSSVRFEFYAIIGKTYTIERSSDAKTWTRLPFAIGTPAAGALTYQATDVSILSAYATPTANAGKEFYRLTVR